MGQADKRYGNPRRIPFTPSSGDVSAGDVILAGNLVGIGTVIATQDIANAVEGSVEIGGGVYQVTMLSNIAQYGLAYWDDTNNKLTSTSTNNAVFGVVVEGGGGGVNAVVYAYHDPMAPRV